MEDRVAHTPSARPGAALGALAVIIIVTAVWWALALFPSGGTEPEWLERTRSACFGSAHGGLPNAGGWILLLGEPAGMIAALFTVWGDALKRDLAVIWSRHASRVAALAVGTLLFAGIGATSVRVANMLRAERGSVVLPPGIPLRVDAPLPSTALVDQHGEYHSLHDLGSGPALFTFAFAHCASVCPTLLSDLRTARRTAGRADIPIIVITLDPWRDTPDRLPTIATQWMLAANDRIVSGHVQDVQNVLDALGIGRTRDSVSGDMVHVATVMIAQRGRITWRVEGGVGGIATALARVPQQPTYTERRGDKPTEH